MRDHFPTNMSKSLSFVRCMMMLMLMQASLASFSQKRNGYLGLDAGVYIIKNSDPAVGAHFNGNAQIANDAYLGAEIGVVKIDGLRKAYLPLLARVSMMPNVGSGRTRLLILLAPGYGLYDDTYRRGGVYYHQKGGFSFYGGFGAAFLQNKNASLALTVGYSTFGISTNGYKSNIDGVGIRFGVMLK